MNPKRTMIKALLIGLASVSISLTPSSLVPSLALAVNLLIGLAVGAVTHVLVPQCTDLLISAGLFGRDLHRPGRPKVPEATGVVLGAAYASGLALFLPFVYRENEKNLLMFMGALLSINSMCFLGFADNVLNLRWRVKLIVPFVASLPLLLLYYSTGGSTSVLLPPVISNSLFGSPTAIQLGPIFYVFLACLAVFGTNAINILAGVNGLESGQTVVLAGSLCLNSAIQFASLRLSFFLLWPFLCGSVALYRYNRYPASVFVGDTFCYLSGMTLAASGVIGHCTKTVLLFMLPQVVNFLYSLPQLLKVIPCPRHRLPVYLADQDLVGVSFTDWIGEDDLNRMGWAVVRLLEVLRLAEVQKIPCDRMTDTAVSVDHGPMGVPLKSPTTATTRSSASTPSLMHEREEEHLVCSISQRGIKVRVQNLTLLNLVLWKLGPMHEESLTRCLLGIQIAWSLCAFWLRYYVAELVYSSSV